eukprot:355084-Chlamydomonas_euryale.AAC.3
MLQSRTAAGSCSNVQPAGLACFNGLRTLDPGEGVMCVSCIISSSSASASQMDQTGSFRSPPLHHNNCKVLNQGGQPHTLMVQASPGIRILCPTMTAAYVLAPQLPEHEVKVRVVQP